MANIWIFSTMTGQQWEGESRSADLEDIFREFNRVDQADVDHLVAKGYNLPSLSAGDFVCVEDQWYLCASAGWEPVTQRQAIIPQMDRANAVEIAGDVDQVRPPMFFSKEGDDLKYMTPGGWWKIIPAQGPTRRVDNLS